MLCNQKDFVNLRQMLKTYARCYYNVCIRRETTYSGCTYAMLEGMQDLLRASGVTIECLGYKPDAKSNFDDDSSFSDTSHTYFRIWLYEYSRGDGMDYSMYNRLDVFLMAIDNSSGKVTFPETTMELELKRHEICQKGTDEIDEEIYGPVPHW